MKKVQFTETVLRDASQSLVATRMNTSRVSPCFLPLSVSRYGRSCSAMSAFCLQRAVSIKYIMGICYIMAVYLSMWTER